jgi:hypothetical protein
MQRTHVSALPLALLCVFDCHSLFVRICLSAQHIIVCIGDLARGSCGALSAATPAEIERAAAAGVLEYHQIYRRWFNPTARCPNTFMFITGGAGAIAPHSLSAISNGAMNGLIGAARDEAAHAGKSRIIEVRIDAAVTDVDTAASVEIAATTGAESSSRKTVPALKVGEIVAKAATSGDTAQLIRIPDPTERECGASCAIM